MGRGTVFIGNSSEHKMTKVPIEKNIYDMKSEERSVGLFRKPKEKSLFAVFLLSICISRRPN